MRRAESRETEPTQGKELIAHGVQPATLPAPGSALGHSRRAILPFSCL